MYMYKIIFILHLKFLCLKHKTYLEYPLIICVKTPWNRNNCLSVPTALL